MSEIDIMCKNLSEMKYNTTVLIPDLLGDDLPAEARISLNNVVQKSMSPTVYWLNTSVRVGDKMVLGYIEAEDTTIGTVVRALRAQARYFRSRKLNMTIDSIHNIEAP